MRTGVRTGVGGAGMRTGVGGVGTAVFETFSSSESDSEDDGETALVVEVLGFCTGSSSSSESESERSLLSSSPTERL